jgi:hypothetical protein
MAKPVFPDLNWQHASFVATARSENCGDIFSAETLFAAIPERRVQIAGLNSEPGSPFGPPRANNRPTATGLHANQKAVRALTFDDWRLESAFHFKSLTNAWRETLY